MTTAERYAIDAKNAGVALDQLQRLLDAGLVFTAAHLRFLGAARQCDRPDGPEEILCGGGRGSGKTNAVLAQMLVDDCQRAPGIRCLSIRKTAKSSREQVLEVRKKILSNVPHTVNESSGIIKFPNGSQCVIGGFKDEKDFEKYIGQEYDVIHIAECNQITKDKEEALLTCLRTSRPGWRVRAYLDTNPGGISHEHHRRKFVMPHYRGQETTTQYFHSTLADNPFIDEGYRVKMERLTGNRRKAWLDGDWDFRAGAYFSMWSHAHHVIGPGSGIHHPATPKRWYAGYDYGISHPASFHLMCDDFNGNSFVVDRWHKNNCVVKEQAAGIRGLLAKWKLEPGDLAHIAAGHDCFNRNNQGRTTAELFALEGLRLSEFRPDRISNWATIANRLGDPERGIPSSLYVSDRCVELIECIPLMAERDDREGDLEKWDADENGEGGDDALDSCRNGLLYRATDGVVTTLPKSVYAGGPLPPPNPLPRAGRLW